MSNTPEQQADLYRKAADTIEMCAEHGIIASARINGNSWPITETFFMCEHKCYEFPLAVIEGQLVWADTIVYDAMGYKLLAQHMMIGIEYFLTKQRQPLCEVEGKPVYKGDTLYMSHGVTFQAYEVKRNRLFGGELAFFDDQDMCKDLISKCSWKPPKRTVIVELLVEDAEQFSTRYYSIDKVADACRKALDNQNRNYNNLSGLQGGQEHHSWNGIKIT